MEVKSKQKNKNNTTTTLYFTGEAKKFHQSWVFKKNHHHFPRSKCVLPGIQPEGKSFSLQSLHRSQTTLKNPMKTDILCRPMVEHSFNCEALELPYQQFVTPCPSTPPHPISFSLGPPPPEHCKQTFKTGLQDLQRLFWFSNTWSPSVSSPSRASPLSPLPPFVKAYLHLSQFVVKRIPWHTTILHDIYIDN